MITRQEIFAQAAKKLRQDFAELSVIPHSGLKGGEAEDLVRRFLRGHLPKRFDVGSGFIIDALDNLSKQTDVIIYDALNCPVYRASDTAAIIPSDNAAAVIEVKSRLDKEKLREAFLNIVAVKNLAKTKLHKTPFPTLITTQTFCCVFAFETSISLSKLAEHYGDFIREFNLGRHIDVVLILDKGIINLAAKMQGGDGWNPIMMEGMGGENAEGAHISVGATPMAENSLDMFLRLLLAHLIHFRESTAHPGFKWDKGGVPAETLLGYLTSISNENDPILRNKKLKQYQQQVAEEFAKRPIPKDWDAQTKKDKTSATETPAVIHLPSPNK